MGRAVIRTSCGLIVALMAGSGTVSAQQHDATALAKETQNPGPDGSASQQFRFVLALLFPEAPKP